MRVIHIQARYPDALSELSGASNRDACLAIESLISVALLEFCGEIVMDRVWLTDEADEDEAGSRSVRSRSRRSGA